MSFNIKRYLGLWVAPLLLLNSAQPLAADAPSGDSSTALFAQVNGQSILLERYVRALKKGFDSTFYHGRPPEDEITEFQLQVGHTLVDEILLLQDAGRRGISADGAWVGQRLERQIQRYNRHPEWAAQRESVTVYLMQDLERQSQLNRLEAQIHGAVSAATDRQLEAYYQANRDKFTTPVRERVSLILLKVQPWEGVETWDKALLKARQLEFQLKEGADFSSLARQHSQDASAAQGGDMGFLHQGMLGDMAQRTLNRLEPGQLSGPVRLLEGVVILRLEEREESRLNPFQAVKARVASLWLDAERDRVYKRFMADLRDRSEIEIVAPEYLDLPGATKTGMSTALN